MPRPDREAIVAITRQRRRRSWLLRGLLVLLLSAFGFGVYRWQYGHNGQPKLRYITTDARIGELREVVTATGTLKGLNAVDVGAQISGRVAKVLVDYNDIVKAGQVLAEIDREQLK